MKNNYFQFKQFTVRQDQSAMKVCTDACMFGAWVAEKVHHLQASIHNILDIGAGTGLLSLMLAQKTSAVIDAVEADGPAFRQAAENIACSAWNSRIHMVHADVNEYAFQKKYELIISNPPFYEHDLPSPHHPVSIARHSHRLTLHQLLTLIADNLRETGYFAVLLPYRRTEYFLDLARSFHYHAYTQMLVRHSPAHHYSRSFLLLGSHGFHEPLREEITIKEDNGYTKEFSALLKDYYLHL